MEIILTALLSGAAAASQDLLKEGAADLYGWIKRRLSEKFSRSSDRALLEDIEAEPEDQGLQESLRGAVSRADAERDEELVKKATELLDILRSQRLVSKTSCKAVLHGDGAISQGPGSVAVGKGGVAVAGNVSGGIRVGTPRRKS